MVRKIGIIGMGHVGSTIAHALIVQGAFDEYILIDTNEEKVRADQMDLQDAAMNLAFPTKISCNNYTALTDADLVICALGNIALQDNPDADRFAELPFTAAQIPLVATQLKEVDFKGVLIVISNPVDVVTSLFQYYTGFPKEKVIGTGTLLDTARMKRAVGDYFGVHPKSISGYNLGEHGNSQFTAWSQVRVKGQAITKLEGKAVLDALSEEAIVGGHRVFFGKKYTSYGIASAAIRLALAIVSDSREELPVSQYYEPLGTYLSYPAIIGRKGLVERVQLNLTAEEDEKLQESARYIKEKFAASITT